MGVIYLCFYVFELPRVLGITDKNVTLRVFSGSIKINYVPNKIHFPLDISQSATEQIRCHQNRDRGQRRLSAAFRYTQQQQGL